MEGMRHREGSTLDPVGLTTLEQPLQRVRIT
jgi:hypothetical protein